MAKCCGNTCACKIAVNTSNSFTVTGTGTSQDPFVFHDSAVVALDTTDIDTTVTLVAGLGWQVSSRFATTSRLSGIGDVSTTPPAPGQVLTWSGTAWHAVAPVTAEPGVILTDTSLQGDGSPSKPLAARLIASSLITTPTGIDLSLAARSSLVRRYASDSDREAAIVAGAPVQTGSITTLDDHLSRADIWTGSEWKSLSPFGFVIADEEISSLSGSYIQDKPINVLTKQVDENTDENGVFPIFDEDDLAARAGVLTAWFQPTGTIPFTVTCNVDPDDGTVTGVASATDGSGLMESVPVTGWAIAFVY